VRGHVFHQYFLFAAESAANARFDHADAFHRQVQHWREHAPHMERHLRGRANDEPVIFIPIRHTDVRLDVRLLYLWHFILCFENFICFLEPFFHIANVNADLGGEIPRWI
jgi:hypothetical protein